jgi:hypothetical protein
LTKPLVYLCGPITGLSYQDARHGWRGDIRSKIDKQIDLLSPMRQEKHLSEIQQISPEAYPDNPVSTELAIISKDFLDVQRSTLVVANFLGATQLSVGSICEVSWAYALRKQTVFIMEATGAVHDRFFLKGQAQYFVTSVDQAADIVNSLLLPGI